MKIVRTLVAVLLFLAVPSLLLAQRPVGGDLQVNAGTQAAQQFPHVATNRSGEFVVTWVSAGPGSGSSLHATRFNPDGTAATGEILVSDQADAIEPNSAVALMDDGSFVVVFPEALGSVRTLMAHWYTPAGAPDGAGVVTAAVPVHFAISTNGDGGMVAVWQMGASSAWFRVFRPNHSFGPEVLVDLAGTDPAVAVGPQGAFVVAWRHGQILARRFTSVGVPSGRRFVVDSENSGAGAGTIGNLRVGKEADGDFLVLWGPGPTVFGRRFKSDATPLGGLIRVQAGTGYDAAIGGQGNFVLVWEAPDATNLASTNVVARRFRSDGAPLGPQVRVNEHTKGSQTYPQVGIGSDGGFTVVWQSRPAENVSDVFARLFERK
jgi:hypothetical protein